MQEINYKANKIQLSPKYQHFEGYTVAGTAGRTHNGSRVSVTACERGERQLAHATLPQAYTTLGLSLAKKY